MSFMNQEIPMKTKNYTQENMIEDPGIYIVQHHKHSKSSARICKLSDLEHLSLPRRAALEFKKDEVCKAILDKYDKGGLSINDQVNLIFDIISRVDSDTSDKENGLFILDSDW
jgi:DNA-nicking Smr family endonuclease